MKTSLLQPLLPDRALVTALLGDAAAPVALLDRTGRVLRAGSAFTALAGPALSLGEPAASLVRAALHDGTELVTAGEIATRERLVPVTIDPTMISPRWRLMGTGDTISDYNHYPQTVTTGGGRFFQSGPSGSQFLKASRRRAETTRPSSPVCAVATLIAWSPSPRQLARRCDNACCRRNMRAINPPNAG